MKKTNIDYLTHTWNPIAMRCDPVSEGCSHCWHLDMCERMAVNPVIPREKQKAYSGDGIILDPQTVVAPLIREKPAIIGVQFMGDLFHDKVPFREIYIILDVIKRSPKHQYIILTKRPDRMLSFARIYKNAFDLPNLWMGVSIEDQKTADQRIPLLIQVPARNRILSIEPMLGAINIPFEDRKGSGIINWIISGGESGAYARPLNPEWVRSLRDQCKGAGVPFFHKQNGEWEAVGIDCLNLTGKPGKVRTIDFNGDIVSDRKALNEKKGHCYVMSRCGKKQAGHLIDGEAIRQVPEAIGGIL